MLAYLNQKGHPSNFFYRNLKGVFLYDELQ